MRKKIIGKTFSIGLIMLSLISTTVFAGSCVKVASSTLDIKHNSSVNSVYRKFSKDIQSLSYYWNYIENGADGKAVLNVKIQKKKLLSNGTVQTKKLTTSTTSSLDTVKFPVGSGTYRFVHSTSNNNKSTGRFISNNVIIFTEDEV